MAHARLANQMGIPDSNILLCEDGDVVMLSDGGIDFAGRGPVGYLYVDGIVGDVGHGVLRLSIWYCRHGRLVCDRSNS